MTTPGRLSAADRSTLRSALSSAAPWLTWTEGGPTTVDAGSCDRCGVEPRLVGTCGPVAWRALCRACAQEVGLDAWCDGHEDDGAEVLRWLTDLPSWWGDAVVAWWIATGEVTWDGEVPAALPAPVRAALPALTPEP